MNDETRQDLHAWLAALGRPATDLTPLAGDVSRRAYLRALHEDGTTSIVATYPAEMTAVCRRFARTTRLLEKGGIRVPRLLARDCGRGRSLLEDAGEETLYDRHVEGGSDPTAALELAAAITDRLRRLPADEVAGLNPPLDGELFRRELEQTWELLLVPRALAGEGAARERLRVALEAICDRLDAEPRVPSHRDFMARNLVPTGDGGLVVLDHQDLRLGPPAYDLASLLNDSLFATPELERRLVARHLTGPDGMGTYRRSVVQRTLKACGTYAAFAQRGATRHLRLVAPTLRRAADNLGRLPEGQGLEGILAGWRAATLAV